VTRATLLHVFPSFAVGGQQTRFATIANALGAEFRHRIVSLDGRADALALLQPALDVALVPTPPRGPGMLGRIARFLSGHHADLLVTYNWGAIDWAIVNRFHCRRPHFHFEDGFGLDEADRQKRRRVLVRALALRQSQILVPARALARIATERWWLAERQVHYIPNGIDAARFDGVPPDPPGRYFSREVADCVIGSFSPLRPEKNIARLLRVFATIASDRPQLRLVICGDGPERDDLVGLAAGLGISNRVAFAGHVAAPELVMGGFDILAMTSDTEQMPYAVLEGMAARLPILATDVGDIAVMVSPENRPFIVPRTETGRFAEAAGRLCADPTLRRAIGRCNRERVEAEFSIGRMVDAFHRLLDGAITRPEALAPAWR